MQKKQKKKKQETNTQAVEFLISEWQAKDYLFPAALLCL